MNIDGCPSFKVDATGESLLCEAEDQPGPVLHRSHATRVHVMQGNETVSAAPMAGALGFDDAGARFAFSDRQDILVWDSGRGALGELGKGELSPVLFARDGRHAAYLRRGPTSSNTTEDLMLFDAVTAQSRLIASGTPMTSLFAQFSPDGAGVVYAANDTGDGSGLDLVYESLTEDTATVIAPKVQSATRQPFVFFGASGRDLFFTPESGPGAAQPLSRVDLTTHTVTDLGTVTDFAASPTGSFFAFVDTKGQIVIWDDATGSTRIVFKPDLAPDDLYRSGFTASADGHRFAFLTSNGHGSIYDAAPPAGKPGTTSLGVGGISCYSTSSSPPQAAVFAADGSGAFYWPTQMPGQSDCYGGSPSPAFAWLGFSDPPPVSGPPRGDVSAFGPHGEVLSHSEQEVNYWSPTRGVLSVLDLGAEESTLPQLTAAFTDSGLALSVFNYATSDSKLLAWDAASAKLTELTSALSARFPYLADAASGQVAFAEDTMAPALELWIPGSAEPQALLDIMDNQVVSASRKRLAAHGTRGTEQGLFVFRLGDSEATLVEEGRPLGISDTHVYFQALDGVCVQAL